MEAQRGRLLSADEDKSGEAPVVVISDRLWRSRFDADSDVVGQTLRINGQNATIVGITPTEVRRSAGALSDGDVCADDRAGHDGSRTGQ